MEIVLAIVGPLIGTALGAGIAGVFALKGLRREHQERLRSSMLEKQTVAYEKFWERLEPTSTSEFGSDVGKARLIHQDSEGYYLNKEAIDSFFGGFSQFFYSQHGLFLSKQLRKSYFEARDYYTTLVNITEKHTNGRARISKTKARKAKDHWDWVITVLRNDLGLRDVQSPFKGGG